MQTIALLVDSYRLLISRKLFWITLFISAMVVVLYGSIGFSDKGVSLLFGLFTIETDLYGKDLPWARILYLWLFSEVIVGIWLTWAATILALVSTTSIFPDFMAAGAIDLVLAKPISRVKIFCVKYLGSLLFVLLQVGLFCIGVFLCVGARLGDWNWTIFAAIPLVVLFYSYLYAINVLLAIVTRSALAALLFTILIWFFLGSVQLAEGMLHQQRIAMGIEMELARDEVVAQEKKLPQLKNKDSDPTQQAQARAIELSLEEAQDRAGSAARMRDTWTTWHKAVQGILIVLPKTQETLGLLDRWLVADTEQTMKDLMLGEHGNAKLEPRRGSFEWKQWETARRAEEAYHARPVWLILGTSLAFELAVLAIACFLFVRRDF